MIPKSGSAYIYTYSTFGELPAWIVGWNQNLRYGGTTATQSRGWSSYVMQLLLAFGITAPSQLNDYSIFGFQCSPLAAVFLISLTVLQNQGSKKAGNFNNVVTIGKLAILAFIICVSLFYFDIRNFDPFYIEDKGLIGIVEASTILFFGYLGFDFITTISEEALNPIRDVPVAILFSVILSMVIYTIVTFSVSGVGNLSLSSGDGETALSDIFADKGITWMELVIIIAAILGISAAALTNLMSQSRILYSYAKDGLFF